MKRLTLTLLLMILTLLCLANVNRTYLIDKPVITENTSYTSIALSNAQSWGDPGNPNLPWVGIKLLLPTSTEANSIIVKRSNPITYMVNKPIEPIQQQYPFSHKTMEAVTTPNALIYTSQNEYPVAENNGLSTYYLSGNPIAFSAVCPFTYYPQDNKLVFYQTISVEISYTTSERGLEASSLLKQDAFTQARIQHSVDNPEMFRSSDSRPLGYNYLMIIDQAKYDNWLPLKTLYESRGMNVLVKSVSEITANVAGADTQQKIRNFIIQTYATNPLRYVFLGGDTDVIPHRGMYVNLGQGSYTDEDIPADMYYSCLDGNWDNDADGNWGENGEEDLAPELAIGRFCYNSNQEIANFLNKVMSYVMAPVESEIRTAFFAGEWLWDGPTWAGDYMDEMIGGSNANGYSTVGVPNSWTITTLYDRTFGSADSWGASQIRPLLSQGANFVNHLGHSNTTYNMRLSNNQVSATSITNNGSNHNYSIYFTQGCYAGSFDNRDTEAGNYTDDCITEKFTSIATAAVAMISHSRYGWGEQGGTDGASQNIHRQYNDAIFGEGIHELGYTLVDSKIDNIPYINNTPVMHWVTYETNLFGDPAMMLWTDTPQTVSANLPSEWIMGMNSLQIQTNAPYAMFTLKSGDITVFETEANAMGLVSVNLFSSLTPGDYQVYINAPNFYAYENGITVTAAQIPYIVCSSVTFTDADGLHQVGEEIDVNLYAKNVGLVGLDTPANLSLSSPSSNIQILTPPISINNIATGDSLAYNAAFRVRIVGSYEDGSRAKLVFTATHGDHNSQTEVYLPLNAPNLSISSYQIENHTNVVMPGDNPAISLVLDNSGSGDATTPMLVLFCDSPYLSIAETEIFFTPIIHQQSLSVDNAINVNVSPTAPLDTDLTINYMLSAENGNTFEGSFAIHLGAVSFGFEPDFQGWQALSLSTGYTNQWHRSSNRNHTSSGQYSMKFGGSGSGQYSGNAHGALESPDMAVSPGCQLKFFHWMQAETHDTQQNYAWDGGFVQMKLNNGTWQQITPVGGYPYSIFNNPASPLDPDTEVYSGTFGWTEATFELGNVSGTAKFRWIFGSDGYVGGEGWYIDDVRIYGNTSENEDIISDLASQTLFTNYPNPFNPKTNIRFSIPENTMVNLDIYNLKGQHITSLVNTSLGKGIHSVIWEGTDKFNQPVASGVYFYTLRTGLGVQTQKMLLMK